MADKNQETTADNQNKEIENPGSKTTSDQVVEQSKQEQLQQERF